MKLYATVTSERATKGQGGNTRCDISFTAGEERAEVLNINTYPTESKDKYCFSVASVDGELWAIRSLKTRCIEAEKKILAKGKK